MTGGEILIEGNAGNEIGHSLRRGLIAIGGDAGDAVGVNMLAGTILICGQAGIRPGAGMRRGTIVLAGHDSPELLPTFRASGVWEPTFLRIYLKQLLERGFPLPEESLHVRYRRYCGDLLELGKGEVLLREAAARGAAADEPPR
jgi:formylmethanofuran dehydrogenase subunit C